MLFFSNGAHLFISKYHLVIDRWKSDFHETAMHFLATARAISPLSIILYALIGHTSHLLPQPFSFILPSTSPHYPLHTPISAYTQTSPFIPATSHLKWPKSSANALSRPQTWKKPNNKHFVTSPPQLLYVHLDNSGPKLNSGLQFRLNNPTFKYRFSPSISPTFQLMFFSFN